MFGGDIGFQPLIAVRTIGAVSPHNIVHIAVQYSLNRMVIQPLLQG